MGGLQLQIWNYSQTKKQFVKKYIAIFVFIHDPLQELFDGAVVLPSGRGWPGSKWSVRLASLKERGSAYFHAQNGVQTFASFHPFPPHLTTFLEHPYRFLAHPQKSSQTFTNVAKPLQHS